MSFVQWVTALALLVVATGGAYGGITALLRRNVEVPPCRIDGRGAILLALLYLAAGIAAFVAALLIFISR